MAATPPSCCFRLEATRGPHSGCVHCYCSSDQPLSPSSPSHARPLSIGRKKRCWLRLPKDLEVSSVHAEFRFVDGGQRVALRDAKSTNGTKLNGSSLKPLQDYPLGDGDVVAVGRTSLRFVQVVHGQQCREEGDVDDASTTPASGSVLTSGAASLVARPAADPVVIVLDDESAEEREASAASGSASLSASVSVAGAASGDTPVGQPDTEPAHDDLVLKPLKSVVVSVGDKESKKDGNDDVETSLAKKRKGNKDGNRRAVCVDEFTSVVATCMVCKATIGQLDLLEQQAHLNECLGGRVVVKAPSEVKPKTRKRASTASGATRAKKPRKPKAEGDEDPAALPKPKKPRKRKRADVGENIELALALTGKSKMDKEQQTDIQLKATKKKLEDLDVQMAKLAKRRANLVKTLDRLERTKEKLRKSEVLPPGKVKKFLDLKAALDAIFPDNRQAHTVERYAGKTDAEDGSDVAKRYAPTKWSVSEAAANCDEEKQAELAAVAAISMWARASQQLFGLQRDTLLYRNTVLRAFLGDDDVDSDSFVMGNADSADNDDEDAELEREIDSEARAESAPAPENVDGDDISISWTPCEADVPAVVKRVFPNWQRDMIFLQDQTAEELEMALEAMNEAVAQVKEDTPDDVESNRGGEKDTEASVEPVPNDLVMDDLPASCSKDQTPTGSEERRACEYMAQVMTQLIAEKRQCAVASNPQSTDEQQDVVDLLDSSSESVREQQQQSDTIDASDAKEQSYSPATEQLQTSKVVCSSPIKSAEPAPTAEAN
ncbi:SMAD/FHA domain [Phytophthora cinnamomi]|uniref:SMAD/FHA domain n=1 Tax=Phytophthora cinnamomi TaxID=4785 RepID=UPI003559A8B4|nr:SMAD/FHA domain [Phytophthora cinnamomi]